MLWNACHTEMLAVDQVWYDARRSFPAFASESSAAAVFSALCPPKPESHRSSSGCCCCSYDEVAVVDHHGR